MSEKLTITCPIRGRIKVRSKTRGGLTPLEEYYRVEAIRHLIKSGYPKDNILIEAVVKRFGSQGRNSFRCDLAVLDAPTTDIETSSSDTVLEHSVLLVEVKRENNKSDYSKHTQVGPLLDFAKNVECLGVYWDNVEHRVFWQKVESGKRVTYEGPISFLPKYGDAVSVSPLQFKDLDPSDSLLELFSRVEDILHQASLDKAHRFQVILQLLLCKIFDEHGHSGDPNSEMDVQDFRTIGVSASIALSRMNKLLKRAIGFYEKHLPDKVSSVFPITGDVILDVCGMLAPVQITRSKREVVQTFYMKFAKDLYKWDLAQYFTPPTVTDFIVEILNPRFGEHVYDPACGSADFLIAAFHKLRAFNTGYADNVWGSDNSATAVQVSVLNMLLNGDGKANIHQVDSLETVNDRVDKYDVIVCNPPFGVKIKERRSQVLRKFDLGHKVEFSNGPLKIGELLPHQETGILFLELCVRQCKPGGRIGIILPNGYLGNRSQRYLALRQWLLRRAKVVAIAGFPRFTFKSSGADVSASIVYLERLEKPVEKLDELAEYSIAYELIDRVGWDAGNKRARLVYERDQNDGSLLVDEDGEFVIDADFGRVINSIRGSDAGRETEWLCDAKPPESEQSGWSVRSEKVLGDPLLTLDPKRHCEKYRLLVDHLVSEDHFRIGDLFDIISDKVNPDGSTLNIDQESAYRYVELQRIRYGDYDFVEMRGWQLPTRARHVAASGDVFVAAIWSSVDKWCLVSDRDDGILVTNGCHHLRPKAVDDDRMIDFVGFVCTEAWRTQMRALARGSDGLAEVSEDDLKSIVVPRVFDQNQRRVIEEYVVKLRQGALSLEKLVSEIIEDDAGLSEIEPAPRSSHMCLV